MRLSRPTRLLLALPAVAALGLFFVAPVINIVLQSFHVNTVAGTSSAWTFGNYTQGLLSSFYRSGLLRSLWISVVVTVIAVVVGFPFAQVYARARGPWRFVLTLVLFLPLLTTSIVTSYGWLILLGKTGLVNSALQSAGLVSGPVNFLYTPAGIIIGLEEWILPFVILPIATSLAAIPPEMYKASASLGAGRTRTFATVTVPLARGGIISGAVVAYALSMSSYTTPRLISGGVVQVLPITIYNEFMSIFNIPLGSALSVLLLIVVVVPVAIFGRGRGILGGEAR